MARSRNIKPGFYKNEDLAECSIWARFIFPGLWQLSDRNGLLEDRPKRIKGELLPYDTVDMEPLLAELHARKFIVRYKNAEGSFIFIPGFSTHQSPHYSEKPSGIKPPQVPVNGGYQEPSAPSVPPESSENGPTIKRGAEPPDSLIPSSLIPDSTTTPPSPPNRRGGVDNPGRSKPPAKPKASRAAGQWWRSNAGIIAKGEELGIKAKTGEFPKAYADRLRDAIADHKAAKSTKNPGATVDAGNAGSRGAPPSEPLPTRARDPEPVSAPLGSWAVTYSLAQIVLTVQPTWTAEHVEAMARTFRQVPSVQAGTSTDWDSAFVEYCATQDPLPPEPDDPSAGRDSAEPSPTAAATSEDSEPALGEGIDAGLELELEAEPRWWENPDRVMARAVELQVQVFENEDFSDFTARVLAALGPGPHEELIEDGLLLQRIRYFAAVGVNTDAARPTA